MDSVTPKLIVSHVSPTPFFEKSLHLCLPTPSLNERCHPPLLQILLKSELFSCEEKINSLEARDTSLRMDMLMHRACVAITGEALDWLSP